MKLVLLGSNCSMLLALLTSVSLIPVVELCAQVKSDEPSAAHLLGRRLFQETQFSNPVTSYPVSCASCHSPKLRAPGRPAFADLTPRSLIPVSQREKSTTRRNTPTLLDVAKMPRLYHDGRFDSLQQLVKSKLVSRQYGWYKDTSDRAEEEIVAVLVIDAGVDRDSGGPYLDQFEEAYDVDLTSQSEQQVFDLLARCITDYLKTLRTTNSAPWDAFASMNRIPPEPNAKETPDHYAGRVFGRIGNQEGRWQIKLVDGLDVTAYQGFKTFFRTSGDDSVGNCVSCHVPPTFTDFKFHNTGISQVAYETVHGAGRFNQLAIPREPELNRPSGTFLSAPSIDDPGRADLGHWNYVDVQRAPGGNEGETPDALLDRMVGAFKTPTLRNLSQSAPYMHNGAYKDVEEVVAEIVRINRLARDGKLRSIDPEYRTMNITERDIKPLTAFLKSLDEVPPEKFRDLLLSAQVHTGKVKPR